jgi:serine/threonine-protein kinase
VNLVVQLKAEHLVGKLRAAREIDARDLSRVQSELAEMGASAIAPILRCLAHGDARRPALEILDRLATHETLDTLIEALSSPNPVIASGVAQVLARNRQLDVSRLIGLLAGSRPPKATLEAVLREHAASLPVRSLMQVFPKLEKSGQAVVFRLLEATDSFGILNDLAQLLAHEDWWVRMNAARLLGRHHDPIVVQALIGRLQDPHKLVRFEAVSSLHQMKAVAAVPALVACLRDADYKVQTAAIDTLTELADGSAVRHLIEVLTDDSEYARRGAVEVLNAVATVDALQDLVRALRDEDWWVRVRAADALGALGGDKVVDAVLGLLDDTDDFIRRHAVEILNAIPSPRAVPKLLAALEDPDWWVRERAIDALGKNRDPLAVDALLRCLATDPGPAVLCVRALAAIGDHRAVRPLVELIDSDRAELRHEAIEALKALPRDGMPAAEQALVESHLGQLLRATPASSLISDFENVENGSGRYVAPSPLPRVRESVSPPLRTDRFAHSAPSSPSPRPVAERPSSGAPVTFTDVANLEPGTVLLDRYRIRRRIGRGGFGAVYLVEDTFVQEDVILKLLHPQLSADEGGLRRFIRELKLARRITHRNVIRLHDLLDMAGAHAVSMEYFPSRDLGRILMEDGPMASRRVLQIMAQVCEGLAAAHAEGVIHRDIKPANVLVGLRDEVKIVDFGLAAGIEMRESRLTSSGVLIGTPEYMAPEQISGETVDGRADVYAVGIMMYELLTGVKPFTAPTPVKVLFLHLEGEARPLRELAPQVPEVVARIVAAAMQRAAEARPGSPVELRQRILEALQTLEVAS